MQGQALLSKKKRGREKERIHFDLGNSKSVCGLGVLGRSGLHAPFHQKTTGKDCK